VNTARAGEIPFERAVTVTGTLAAFDRATISAKVPGRVRTMKVDLGTVVRQGQAIAELEPRDYQLRLQQAEAALAQARARLGLAPDGSDDSVDPERTGTVRQARALLDEASLNRERAVNLLKQGIISRAELDAAEAEYKVAQSRHQDALEEIRNRQALLVQRRSEVEIARQQLTDMSIRAPFDGVVEERIANRGEYLAVGSPVATIVRMNPLRLRAEVPERESRNVHIGQIVRVSIEGDASTHTGRIARLSPSITAQNRVLIIEAEVINNGQLRPGAFARAEIVADSSNLALAVPKSAIVTFAGIDKVISVQDGKAVEKPVALGRRTAEWAEVLSGLKAGDVVVLDPGNLQSGQPVSVAQ
jgi:RND family efflux transporter MFP subunit